MAAADFRIRHVLGNRESLSCGRRGRFARLDTGASAADGRIKPPSFQAVAGALLILGGIVVMLAWSAQAPWLASLAPDGSVTVFNTALCFFLAGAALTLRATRLDSEGRLRTFLACAMGLLAMLALAENLSAIDLGIDWPQLHQWLRDKNAHPGRMAPNTALAFLLASAALIPRATRSKTDPDVLGHMLPAAVVALGATGVADNAFRLDMTYAWFGVARMAMPTGVAFVLLGSALWLDQRRARGSAAAATSAGDGRIYAFLGVALTILLAIAAVSYGSIHALQDRARWVENAFEARTQFDELLAEYRKARIAWRSYLIDGADANLREFKAAVDALPQQLQATRRLIADNPAQQARLAAMERLLDVDVAALAADVQAKREGSLARAEDALRQLVTGRLNIAELDRVGREFRDEETRLLAVREQESNASARTTTAAIIVGNAAGFVVLLCAFWVLKRQNDRRARLEEALQQANRELESRVEQRTGELARANADLATLNATLEQRDERFRSVAEASQEWIWDTDAHGIHTYCNSAVAAILGRSPEEMVGESALDHIHRDDLPAAVDLLKNAAAEKRGWRELVLRWRHKDGSFRWLESNALPLLGPDGEVIGYRGADRDITDRIEQQEKIARLSRIHAMFSGINSTIVRVHDRQELFREACRIGVADGKFSMAWVGVVDPGTADGSVVATAGVEEGYKAKIRLTSRAGLPHSERPACRALREKMPVICNDIATDPTMAPLRDDALARGYRSVAAFPLLLGGEAHAVLVLYAAQPGFFDLDEVKLLKELAADLTFALDHMAKAARLSYLSYYDTLTGLANRQLFFDRLTQMIHSANSDQPAGVIVVDLQRFRTINDTLGRSAGDKVLTGFASSLQQTFGQSTTVARISGDRFAVAADNVRSTSLAFLIHSWIARSQAHPLVIDGSELHVSFKLGIAIFPADGVNAGALFHNAEAALQRAKDTTDTYVFYSPEMNARVAGHLHFESRLRKAVEQENFLLHYQPKVDLKTRRILGLEALMRWHDPENGFVSPLEFIPILEQTGMIIGAGKWVIEKVVTDMERWRAQKLAVPRVAVNVSQVQVRQKDFVATVLSALRDKRNGRSDVDLEITESLVMEDALASIEKLSQLRAAGMRIFMDDFGTGYSSLSQIAALPLDALKIDRAFVAGMGKKAEAMAIVSTIISLARALKIGVVAEGVETEEQAGLLAALGCDQAQGYLFSRPLPFDEIASLLSLEAVPA